MISEYNIRQINLIKERIIWYKNKKITIDQLVNDLESLLNCLENINEDWKNSFLLVWGELEDIYAFALYENKKQLDDKDIKAINESLVKIDSLLKELN